MKMQYLTTSVLFATLISLSTQSSAQDMRFTIKNNDTNGQACFVHIDVWSGSSPANISTGLIGLPNKVQVPANLSAPFCTSLRLYARCGGSNESSTFVPCKGGTMEVTTPGAGRMPMITFKP